MTRTGIAMVALLALAAAAIALTVRVTGPGLHRADPQSAPAPTNQMAAVGPLVLPVRGVAPASLVDSWSDARGGGMRTHHATDIPAPAGTPVLAAADGRVEKLFTSALGGLTVYQRSADGRLVYYYAHLDSYAAGLAEGQVLHAGQPVGTVGATGDADPTAPHLHFEIHQMAAGERWYQGREIDPFPMLRGASR